MFPQYITVEIRRRGLYSARNVCKYCATFYFHSAGPKLKIIIMQLHQQDNVLKTNIKSCIGREGDDIERQTHVLIICTHLGLHSHAFQQHTILLLHFHVKFIFRPEDTYFVTFSFQRIKYAVLK